VSYGAPVWNADNTFGMVEECIVYNNTQGVYVPGSPTDQTVPPGWNAVLANTFGLNLATESTMVLQCQKVSGSGSSHANNVQMTAIKVASLN
jgi:hypothetical protein